MYSLYIDRDEEEESTNGISELPSFIMPPFHVHHPWNRLGSAVQPDIDFILVAEFSELEGPRPVITIPTGGFNDFNITDFTVRIMSLDHQTSTSHGFHLTEDSQVLISETRDNVFAFVHYLSLYDRHARGFIRPFAISYVTPDHRKLMYFYEELSAQMRKVARFMKYGNKLMFRNELEMYLLDLHFTKAQMLLRHRSSSRSDSENEDRMFQNLKALEALQSETENILRTIKPTLNDKRIEQRFCRLEERAKIEQKRPKADSFSLRDWDDVESCGMQPSGSLGDTSDVENTLFPDNRNYTPKIVKISSDRKFDLHLRGIHELCSWGAREGLQKLRHLYQVNDRFFIMEGLSLIEACHIPHIVPDGRHNDFIIKWRVKTSFYQQWTWLGLITQF
ncbi:hypothetical protein FSP39_004256 [Pinctada imbricata]|uniref:UDENN FLCN/SMCR8-type domain-containing protein n=1 Tax=Pinctada imbricata TaxID=66713 RepID=A0AA88Y348_PINIB|nr:hypothetical protein FSP39_004256 [Pinctada imbricata]